MRILFLFILLFMQTLNAHAVTQWAKGKPASSDAKNAYPAAVQANNSILDTLLSNYRRGVTLTYSSGSTLTASAGEVVVSNAAGTVRLFLQQTSGSNITFSNIDTGSEASSTTYYVYAGTSTATDSAPIFYISLSSSAPAGVTYYRRLGSFVNDGSSNITAIINDNAQAITATGTVSNGGTIALPSGWSDAECHWTVSVGSASPSGSHPDGVYTQATVNSSRVATCTTTSINASGGGSTGTTTCNYIISCER